MAIKTLIGLVFGILILVMFPKAAAQPPASHLTNKIQSQAIVTTAAAVKVVTPTPAPAVNTAEPVQTPTYANGCSTYDGLFRQYNWNVSVAEAICMAESGGSVYAVSSTDDYGLMQINHGLSIYGNQIYQPAFNIAIAYKKYQSQGWEAWTTWNTGAYEQYIN